MKKENDLNQLQLDFISTVSHELRTPLTSIRGFADTLISSHDKLTEEQKLKFLNIIKDQSNRLINLVENLLAASTKASSEELYVLKPVKPLKVIENIVSIIKTKYTNKKIQVNSTILNSEILVDEDKFAQILLNLIENACKYSFENSDVFITVKDYDKDNTNITIENDGITIEEKDKEKIFEKFARLDNPMTRLTQGSGMGLYLANKMTQKMNGKIKLDSQNNHTSFSLIFPYATAENTAYNSLKGN